MILRCKSCDAPLEGDDVNLQTGIGRCSYCGAVMRFAEFAEQSEAAATTTKDRPQVPMPSGFEVEDLGTALEIRRRWFSPVAFFLVFFCIAWNAFLVFWYMMAFGGDAPWIFKVFPIGHVAVGLGILYLTVAMFLNTTTIVVESGRLRIRHSPLPWPGNHELNTDDLDQLYCQKHVRHSKNGTRTTYRVNAVDKNGKKLKLLSGLHESDQAVFIEQQLEEYLGIADREVAGEMSR